MTLSTLLVVLQVVGPPPPQLWGTEPSPLEAPTVLLAETRDGRSVSADVDGSIYLVDGQRVRKLGPDGRDLPFGGSFSDPSAVHAVARRVLVAEGGRGSIAVLGPEGNLLFRVPVPSQPEEFRADPSFVQPEGLPGGSTGLPSDVVSLSTGGFAALEQRGGVLLFWDEAGRPARSVDDAAFRAIALARFADRLVVAGRGAPGLRAYDAFGGRMPDLATGFAGVTALGAGPDRLWLAVTGYLVALDTEGEAVLVVSTDFPDPVTDLAWSDGALLVLTRRRLLRLELPFR